VFRVAISDRPIVAIDDGPDGLEVKGVRNRKPAIPAR
jgi:hypothetical protein